MNYCIQMKYVRCGVHTVIYAWQWATTLNNCCTHYPSIGGFHVTSYQANFASHRTHDHHVGFLFTCKGIGKSNKMFPNFLFSSYHITKLQLSDKYIKTHIRMKFQMLSWRKLKVLANFCCSSPYHAVQKKSKRFLKNRARVSACRVVQTLYCLVMDGWSFGKNQSNSCWHSKWMMCKILSYNFGNIHLAVIILQVSKIYTCIIINQQ